MDQTTGIQQDGKKAFYLKQSHLFLICLALGLVSIGIGKFIPSTYFFFGVLFPIGLMMGYAFINLKVRVGEIAPSQAADNVYFLGFLYFLGSLAMSLYAVNRGNIEIADFIKGFGIALTTTIVGLATRILILQTSHGLPQARERAEATLVDVVNKFREEMTVSTELLVAARTSAIETITTAVGSGSAALHAVVEQTKNTMEGAANQVRDKIQNIDIPADLLINELKPALDECTAAIKALNSVVKKQAGISTTAVNSFGEVVTNSLTVSEKSKELINTLQTAITDLQSKVSVFDSANSAVDSFTRQLNEVVTALGQIKTEASNINDLELTQKISALSAAVEATANAATSRVQEMANTTTGIEELGTAVSGLKGRLAKISTEVQEARQNLANVQAGLSDNLSRQSETISGVDQMVGAVKAFVESQQARAGDGTEIVVPPEIVNALATDAAQTGVEHRVEANN